MSPNNKEYIIRLIEISSIHMEYFESFYTNIAECEKTTLKSFQSELEFINKSLNFYLTMAKKTSNTDEILSNQDFFLITINIKLINSFFCVKDLSIKGLYSDASVILRQILETICLCKKISKEKSFAERWMKKERIRFSSKDKTIMDLYHDLCDYTHSNFPSIINLIDENDHIFENTNDMIAIQPFPYYNKKFVKNLLIVHIFLTMISLNSFYDHFKKFEWFTFNSGFDNKIMKFNLAFNVIALCYSFDIDLDDILE